MARANEDRRAYELFMRRLRRLYANGISIPGLIICSTRSRTFMKWSEIKEAVERSGVGEDDEILEIHCELREGDKTLHSTRVGDFIMLSEHLSEETQRRDLAGCAV
jgi:hypothetical protein